MQETCNAVLDTVPNTICHALGCLVSDIVGAPSSVLSVSWASSRRSYRIDCRLASPTLLSRSADRADLQVVRISPLGSSRPAANGMADKC
jgi:hypothetical protein